MVFGYGADEIVGKNLSIIFPPDKKDEVPIILSEMKKGGKIDSYETVRISKQGQLIDVFMTISPIRDTNGEVIGISSISSDISQRKRLEKSNKSYQARVQAVLDIAVNGIVIIDENKKIELFNPAAEKLFGYEHKEVIGQNVRMLMPEPYREEHDQYVDNYIQSGKAKIIGLGREVVGLKKDGTKFPMDLAVSEMWVGEEQKFVGMITDITKRKKDESELLKAKETAELANKSKSMFLANMSHEIRTPLNAILGYAQILWRDHSLGKEQRYAVDTINKSGNHLLKLINEILDISKIESGKIELGACAFDLSELIDDLAEMFRVHCDQKGLELCVNVGDLRGHVFYGDEGKIRQVLINLMGNAVKFTDRGQIILNVRLDNDDKFSFEVIDTGTGVPASLIDRIFEPFSQGDDGIKKGGTGLGLAITKQQVNIMGGEIKLESNSDGGSKFFFTIPLSRETDAVLAKENKYEKVVCLKKGTKAGVLIVDDVRENRDVLCKFIHSIGGEVYEAANGKEALDVIQTEEIDLVFMDIRMPIMDGVEAVQCIRRQWGSRIKVICITASVLSSDLKGYLNKGFDDMVSKPFKANEIFHVLAKHLDVEYEYEEETGEFADDFAQLKELDFSKIKISSDIKRKILDSASLYEVTRLEEIIGMLKSDEGGGKLLAIHLESLLKTYDMEEIGRVVSQVSDDSSNG